MRMGGFFNQEKVVITKEAIELQREYTKKSYLDEIKKLRDEIKTLEQRKENVKKEFSINFKNKEDEIKNQADSLERREKELTEKNKEYQKIKDALDADRLSFRKVSDSERLSLSEFKRSLDGQFKMINEIQIDLAKDKKEVEAKISELKNSIKENIDIKEQFFKKIEDTKRAEFNYLSQLEALSDRERKLKKEEEFIANRRILLDNIETIIKERDKESLAMAEANSDDKSNIENEKAKLIDKENHLKISQESLKSNMERIQQKEADLDLLDKALKQERIKLDAKLELIRKTNGI